jgi:hypothetical protein
VRCRPGRWPCRWQAGGHVVGGRAAWRLGVELGSDDVPPFMVAPMGEWYVGR